MRVLVIVNKISRENGGRSSALDLVEAIDGLGHETHLGLTSGYFRYVWNIGREYSTRLHDQQILHLPPYIRPLKIHGTAGDEVGLGDLVSRVLDGVAGYRRYHAVMPTLDLIIFACSQFSWQGMKKIRSLTNATLIRNHAGSPETFEQRIVDRALPVATSSSRERYVEYCKVFDGLLFQSEAQSKECIAYSSELERRVLVLRPSSEEGALEAARKSPNPYHDGKKILVNVGSLQPRKAQHLSIEAFKQVARRVPDAELHFVGGSGDDAYAASLQALAEQDGLAGKVFLHGHRHDYARFIAHAHVLLQTSAREGVSRVLREAMFLRVPIASFEIAGTKDLLEAGDEAVLVPEGDVDLLAEGLSRLLGDQEYAKQVAERAHDRYMKNNSQAQYSAAVENMLRSAVGLRG